MKKTGASARRKGHYYERVIMHFFRDILGYKYCKTTRDTSGMLDSCKIDVNITPDPVDLPMLVQVKAGYSNARPKPDQIFREMKEQLQHNFPKEHPIHTKPMLLVHKLDGRKEEDFIATMKWKDMKVLLKNCYELPR